MADEKSSKSPEATNEKGKKSGESGPPGKSPAQTKFIAILVFIALTQVVVAFILVQKFFLGNAEAEKKAPSAHEAKVRHDPEEEVLGETLTLNDIVINPAGTEGKRFLAVSMTLALDAATPAKNVQEKIPAIKDKILELLSSKTVAELTDVSLRKKLREDIMLLINETIAPGRLLRLYFTNYILQ